MYLFFKSLNFFLDSILLDVRNANNKHDFNQVEKRLDADTTASTQTSSTSTSTSSISTVINNCRRRPENGVSDRLRSFTIR